MEEPTTQIVEKGARDLVIATSRGDTRYKKSITMQASAYSAEYAKYWEKPGG